ncbi:hypothetical protein NIES2135_64520 (plasmid) [Leptolyngbya boryana NIES-2135]|jgi:hypothetical protein|uniref:Uncharacterized protein n=1 Tax=Leptolyngbya boryana NIES-2135 TaxID=1973484 RepID=A0A1Z4JS34_LEPBY|nr:MULTISPECIES: hypothetical protein [Leptolyngbya]BAY59575.1 hypothetical protein NIES2135_64520 [Leptolyngbya boryana NIES-2135]MBD2371149.1 hypothetical protein [Leptolyngbya sp. FACHB-161]MBD2377617.1 hypothetical protein [Leptolyngbya sp. FACHB-238]MBD2402053.1 hypothetical protein [Leptolyngbya sp. FACHB-239]MBD2408572.1 hypothetical protein [Leptolyngbya sp. FACHB-402]
MLEELRQRLAVAEAQADSGKFSNASAKDIIRKGKERLEPLHPPKRGRFWLGVGISF